MAETSWKQDLRRIRNVKQQLVAVALGISIAVAVDFASVSVFCFDFVFFFWECLPRRFSFFFGT